MKTLYLVRHAEAGEDRTTEVSYTPKNEYDKPLTKHGLNQASKLSEAFKNISIDRSYTSDYLRAIETFNKMSVNTQTHHELSDIREIFCECIGKNLGNKDLEEFRRQGIRVQNFIHNHIKTINDGETVLVVAHGCLILYLLQKLISKSFGHDMTHTGITKLISKGDGWDFEFFNSSSHLHDSIDPEIVKSMQ